AAAPRRRRLSPLGLRGELVVRLGFIKSAGRGGRRRRPAKLLQQKSLYAVLGSFLPGKWQGAPLSRTAPKKRANSRNGEVDVKAKPGSEAPLARASESRFARARRRRRSARPPAAFS